MSESTTPTSPTSADEKHPRHRQTHGPRAIIVWLFLSCVIGVTGSVASTSPPDELSKTCRELSSGTNGYFSDARLLALDDELVQPGSASESRSPQAALEHANELLKHARPGEAADLLSEALTGVADQRIELALRFRLAVAYLQVAEDQNCLEHRNAQSCIVPVGPGAIHRQKEATLQAIQQLQIVARSNPRDARSLWLLNLAMALAEHDQSTLPGRLRAEAVWGSTDAQATSSWTDRAPELGLDSLDLAGGAVLDDFDGDGLLDIVTSTWDPCDGMKAFRNQGDGSFEPVHSSWGLDTQLGGLNMMQADYDNDGDLDLLVLRGAWLLGQGQIRNSLLRNDLVTDGQFVDVTSLVGLAEPAAPTQTASWADYDTDGDLDLFVGVEATSRDPLGSQLYENLGADAGYRFRERADDAGVVNLRYAKGSSWGDVDNDGDPDLYVSNFGLNRLYLNRGDGTFDDVARELEVTEPAVQSFATWFFDYDNDGDLDLFVADYRPQSQAVAASYLRDHVMAADVGQPLLYRNLLIEAGELGFEEVSRASGITRPALPMGANYADIDNDGWLDVYLGTGEPDLASLMPNQLYRGEGGTFTEITFGTGLGHIQKGHGVAFGDIDNDGDVDLLHQLGGFYPADAFGNALFENPGTSHGWLTLRLVGDKSNRFGVGARVRLDLEAADDSPARTLHRVVGSGGSFGASSLQLEVGLGAAERIAVLSVSWPSGQRDQFHNVVGNRGYTLVEGGELEPIELPSFRLGDAPLGESE